MALAVGVRADFDGAVLRRLARLSDHANQVRRLLALAVIYDSGARHAAAQVGGVGLQTVRDWVLRFNASAINLIKAGSASLGDGAPPPMTIRTSLPRLIRAIGTDRRCSVGPASVIDAGMSASRHTVSSTRSS